MTYGRQQGHPARRWDDWRCYRCNRWQRESNARTPHQTPAGIVVSVCAECEGHAVVSKPEEAA